MLDQSKIQLIKLQKHQLNNQGCKCQMCQKIYYEKTTRVFRENVIDYESETYGQSTKEYFIKIVLKTLQWQQKPRKLRFALPQVCIYENSAPTQLIYKKTENSISKTIRDKSKMHMFEIMQFFLEGYVYHNPEPVKKSNKRRATSFSTSGYSEKYKNQCIIIAKYKNNVYNMLTLSQMEGLFKSRQKYMRDGLLYLQTMVCAKNYTQTRVNIVLRDYLQSQMYQRAKIEIKMFHQQLKSSDIDFWPQHEQIRYQNSLKQSSIRQYLQYLSLKIILSISKNQPNIISQCVFKFVHNNNICYLNDVRVHKIQSSQPFWANAAMKAYEFKLNRRMSMMDVNPNYINSQKQKLSTRYLGKKAQNLSLWLEHSTETQWDQMKIIKTRLQRLQKQKKSLMQSQSVNQNQLGMNKSFKIRTVHKH